MAAAPDVRPASLRHAAALLRRLLVLVRPYWPHLGRSILLGCLTAGLGVISPYLTKLLVDQVYTSQDVAILHVLLLATTSVSLSLALANAVRSYFLAYVSGRLEGALSLLFVNHLQHLPLRFFETHQVGEVTSRFQDVRASLGSVTRLLDVVFVSGSYLILLPPILLSLNWKLALVSFVAIPPVSFLTSRSGRALRRRWRRVAEAQSLAGAYQVELFSQVRNLKVLAIEHVIFRRAADQQRQTLESRLAAAGVAQLFGVGVSVVRAVASLGFMWVGWRLVLSHEISLGAYLAFTAYAALLQGPLAQITGYLSDLQQSAVSLERMFEYLDLETEQDPDLALAAAPAIVHRLRGGVSLEDVCFAYAPLRPVLSGVSFSVLPKTVTAVVGVSGAGKSSLLRLLAAVERPTSGMVRYDGVPAAEISLADLRRQVAVVWQEFSLMRGTLWENLTLGNDHADPAAVEEALAICQMSDFIRDLPEQLQTPVAEWGASLSGGQRQRLALARALIRDAPILLLDEATASIDRETEGQVLRALIRRRDRTIVLVSHRPEVVSLADDVRIVCDGTVQELPAGCDWTAGEARGTIDLRRA